MSENLIVSDIPAPPGIILRHDLPRWYAVHTRSNFEKIVARELVLKGLEQYVPTVREVHRWKDRKKVVEVPVFPGYVFFRTNDCERARLQVLRTGGTVRILGRASGMEAIPDVEIESIRTLLESRLPFQVHPLLREGALVRVKWGPLQGVEGLLARIKNERRLVISVQMLSQSVSTEIDIADIEVLRPPARGARLD